MRAVFISYRRDDSEGQAGRLYDDLVQRFGRDAVFMDVAGIEPGFDFRKVIDKSVASCSVLLALMGPGWIEAKDDAGRRRLDSPTDFVRLETASALKRDIPVIPVLVHAARMPRAEQLPEDLQELAYRNAVELTHARWDSDVQVLIKALERHMSSAPVEERVEERVEPKRNKAVHKTASPVETKIADRVPVQPDAGDTSSPLWMIGGVLVLVAIAVIGWLVFRPKPVPAGATVRIIESTLSANGREIGNHYEGPCPVDLTAAWHLTTTGPSAVSFAFLTNSGRITQQTASPINLGAGTFPSTWVRTQLQGVSSKGSVVLSILAPNIASRSIDFTVSCGGDFKPPPQTTAVLISLLRPVQVTFGNYKICALVSGTNDHRLNWSSNSNEVRFTRFNTEGTEECAYYTAPGNSSPLTYGSVNVMVSARSVADPGAVQSELVFKHN